MRLLFKSEIFAQSIMWRTQILIILGSMVGGLSLQAELTIAQIEDVYGKAYDVVDTVPGRPWVEVQHRYELGRTRIMCNYVNDRCLWIDFFIEDETVDRAFVEAQLEKLFPGEVWKPENFHGRTRWLFNENEDRVTIRAKGFTLHMNEYIKNVLSRRAQWQF